MLPVPAKRHQSGSAKATSSGPLSSYDCQGLALGSCSYRAERCLGALSDNTLEAGLRTVTMNDPFGFLVVNARYSGGAAVLDRVRKFLTNILARKQPK